MKLSTKSRYGVRAMVDLAVHCKSGPVSVADISKREGISAHYLEQILNRLRRHNMVKSVRGPRGGYTLSRGPDKIKVGRIVEILEGGLAPVNCVSKKYKPCERTDRCVTKLVWSRLASCIRDVLNSVTLADLSKKSKVAATEKKLSHEYNFHI